MLSDDAFDRIEALQRLASENGSTLSELAIGWLLSFPWVASVIAGSTRPEQALDNARAGTVSLTPDVARAAGAIGRGPTAAS
jgi:aryl-alcohol dehydrogenase-like predicted oxidoreductase